MSNNLPMLTIVVPCYNEELVLEKTTQELTRVLDKLVVKNKINSKSIILYVDDGSKDSTWEVIEKLTDLNAYVQGLKLSRNFGHQGALIAGLETARDFSDCVISIDADLQDDVDAIEMFIDKFNEGYEIVYGVRDKRDTDTFFKRNTALFYYKLMGKLGVNLVPNHADYRLLSKRALDEFVKYQEENIFIRGIIPLLGFKSAKVYYDRKERFAGESKYPLKKMLAFAFDGITSFSIAPVRFVTFLGFVLVFVGIVIAIYTLCAKIFSYTISGWTSLMLSVWLVGGVQLLAIGIIGEYIGKIFKETKRRPRYTIEKNTYKENQVESSYPVHH
ncbi:MAG: glycosyltransferase family 2 protein [Weizmannia coagulans]|uniref:glycosyltransferase family 2 protein n=1 Tax=Heyndrickxia TaxID=2837504 RepID=UPI0003667687|nr:MULTISPECIES: glycosyltransferase family 2 protein [Heyndrickxia]APB35493.1 glycosyltransferase [Heyndrickxia coagulans]MCI1574651.1 glycosyltransferase family 2 protein [Heyndrickxia coagulans]MED4839843.1 glycosyltransferase family 2 protein [Weizmannia sp. CD-2023]MED4867652.1 glycosyltransferase family 2 protein [Weizmannia sp. CD-2023]MED4900276.1 glycosyltransferase family 2 protein [Weizmannia sp. CD-2023]